MSDDTARDFLDTSKRIEEAATEGPWHATFGGVYHSDGGRLASAGTAEDEAFIAHARTALPKMRAALEAVLELTARRWVCGVFSSGYHNGATCREDDPHAGWGCGFRHEFSVSDEEFQAITAALSAPNEGESA